MTPSLVPIACGTALALMAGAATAHWCSVRDMTRLATMVPQRPAPADFRQKSLPDEGIAREAKQFLAEARGSQPSKGGATPAEPAVAAVMPAGTTDARIERLLQLLEGTVEQNQELRDRIADTNRDLMELRFQVDSYDGQFRPLKVEEEPTFYDDGSAGVLPPLDTNFETP
jgi:hypothetical protein